MTLNLEQALERARAQFSAEPPFDKTAQDFLALHALAVELAKGVYIGSPHVLVCQDLLKRREVQALLSTEKT